MIVPFIIIRTLGERRKKEFEEEGLDLGLTWWNLDSPGTQSVNSNRQLDIRF